MDTDMTGMSEYERDQWAQFLKWRDEQLGKRDRQLPAPVQRRVDQAKQLSANAFEKAPGSDAVRDGLMRAVQGLHGAVTDVAIRTMNVEAVLESYAKSGVALDSLSDVSALDLASVDHAMPDLGFRYSAALGLEGAAAGAAMGGGAMMAAGGGIAGAGAGAAPGVGVTVATMATDISALLTGSTRGVAHHMAYYGFDVRRPEERAFMLATMSLGLVTGQVAKQQAFAQLHRLVGLLARDATWKALNQDAFVRLTGALFAKLGERLVKQKLGQALPIIGAAIGAGLNYSYVKTVTDSAYWLGRERFLVNKYDLYPPTEDDVEAAIESIEVLPDDDS